MSNQGQTDRHIQHRPVPQPRSDGRPAGAPARGDGRSLNDAVGGPAVRPRPAGTESPAIIAEEPVVTAGRNGDQHVSIEWIDVWIGNAKPSRFDVTTLPDHGLEVTVQQEAYKRVFTGTGRVSTTPVPIAPIGTKILVTVVDSVTGERVEQKGVWMSMGGRRSFWDVVKRLFWKG